MNITSLIGTNIDSNNVGLTHEKFKYFWQFIIVEIIAAALLRIFVFMHYQGIFINDTYIFLRYAENMAAGNGLVYNLGEKVLGYSSPLYVVLLAGLKFISMGIPFNIIVFILNLLLFILSCFLFAKLIQNIGISGLIFFTVFCFYFSYIDATVDGMGTMLMLTIVLSALYAIHKDKVDAAYILGVISLLMRPEGALFIASVIIVYAFFKRRIPSVNTILICVFVLLLWLIPTYLYFGNILPDSMLAKSTLFTGQQWGGVKSGLLEKGIMLMFGFSDNTFFLFSSHLKIILYLFSISFAVLFLIAAFRAFKSQPAILTAAIFFVLMLLFYTIGSPVRMFSWYTIVPSVIFLFVLSGIAEIFFNKRILNWLKWLIWGMVLILCIGTTIVGVPYRTNGINEEVNKDRKFIKYLDKTAYGIKSIFISDIGYIGYWEKNWRIIDGSGLVSPQVLARKNGEKLTYLGDIFNEEKPDVIYFKEDILDSNIVTENMRYATFRNSTERKTFLNNYLEVSKVKNFAEIFIRKSLLKNLSPPMLK